MLYIYSQIKVVVENLIYNAVRYYSTKQQQCVKYFYDESINGLRLYIYCVYLCIFYCISCLTMCSHK